MSFRVRTAPISIGHLRINLCSVRVGTTPISIGHCLASSVWVFRILPILINHLHVSSMSVWVFRVTPISIGHLPISLYLAQVFGTAPILIGHFHVSLSFCDSTYVDRSFTLCSIWVLGSYLYCWSSSMLVWVFEAAPISIGHLPVNLCSIWVIGTTPISISHSSCQLSFRDHTYFNQSSSYQFVFSSSWDCIYIDLSLSCQLEF